MKNLTPEFLKSQIELLTENKVSTKKLKTAIIKILSREGAKKFAQSNLIGQADCQKIFQAMRYCLAIIGEYSNSRFGPSYTQQYSFFLKPSESETLFTHLFISIMQRKQEAFHNNGTLLSGSSELGSTPIAELHGLLRKYDKNDSDLFYLNGKTLNERDLYSAAVILMHLFMCHHITDPVLVKKLIEKIDRHYLGTDYTKIDGERGGGRTALKRRTEYQKAFEIFKNYELYTMCSKKHLAIQAELMPLLVASGIRCAPSTLLTRWIPRMISESSK